MGIKWKWIRLIAGVKVVVEVVVEVVFGVLRLTV